MDILGIIYVLTVVSLGIIFHKTRKEIATWGDFFIALCITFIPFINFCALLYIAIINLKDRPTPWSK